MENRICVIADPDRGFAAGLSDYLNRSRGFPFSVHAYTSMERLQTFAKENRVDLLLADAAILAETMDIPCSCRITMGTGEETENPDTAEILKYQPADVLAKQILDLFADRENEIPRDGPAIQESPDSYARPRPGWIGIYSPVGRCGKTGFAVTLGELLSRRKRTVYINLEEYHGLARMWPDMNGTGDLSDLLYFFRQGDGNLYLRISGMLKTFRSLDYIPPTLNGWDIKEVDAAEWISLFSAIEESGGYDYLVLDLGPQVKDVFHILNRCGSVYVPGKEDPISEAKMEQFRWNLETLGCRELVRRIIPVFCPEEKNELRPQEFVAQLLKGKTGQMVSELVRTLER